MEETTTWKGHTFTLLVFGGIVVLCSIFFILGMLVGRAQGQKMASNPTALPSQRAAVDLKPEPKEDKPDFTFEDTAKKAEAPVVLPPPPDPLPIAEAPPKPQPIPQADPPEPVTKAANVLNYQIGALHTSADAEKLLEDVKKKGFRGFILAPPPDDPTPFYRVQVGPISDPVEAQEIKQKLEKAGYQVLLKK